VTLRVDAILEPVAVVISVLTCVVEKNVLQSILLLVLKRLALLAMIAAVKVRVAVPQKYVVKRDALLG
jgi:hypothetical protein